MKCSICGARLKKEGDICKTCYKEFQEEEELKKDTKEQLKIKRKYSIAYEITKYVELIILWAFAMIVCISSGGVWESLAVIGIFALIFGFLLFLDKRLAVATKVVFYEKKAVYTFDMGFINTTKVVKYDDISDVRTLSLLNSSILKSWPFGHIVHMKRHIDIPINIYALAL